MKSFLFLSALIAPSLLMASDVWVEKYCGCLEGRSIIYVACVDFCSQRQDHVPTLVGTVSLENSARRFKDLHHFCTAPIQDDASSPACVLELTHGGSVQTLPMVLQAQSNTFSVDISALIRGQNYNTRILEVTSGATSNRFALRRLGSSGSDRQE